MHSSKPTLSESRLNMTHDDKLNIDMMEYRIGYVEEQDGKDRLASRTKTRVDAHSTEARDDIYEKSHVERCADCYIAASKYQTHFLNPCPRFPRHMARLRFSVIEDLGKGSANPSADVCYIPVVLWDLSRQCFPAMLARSHGVSRTWCRVLGLWGPETRQHGKYPHINACCGSLGA